MRVRTSRATAIAALVLASVVVVPAAASASTVTADAVSISRKVPARDLGPCWAQAGRLVGGFVGSAAATVVNPGLGAAAWAAYLGQVAQEKRTKSGNFAC
jgi:hypothetical protein